jgi:hypothetical protein
VEPWYKVASPRKEVREGRSFNPDEFAIALEQVVAGTAPEDYRDPEKFFRRTYFTRALKEHAGTALRRLAGKTESSAPVLTLVTQFGGGKTHTLTALYHLANQGEKAGRFSGVADLLSAAGLTAVPHAKVAVFVGNAWDPREGRDNPWVDVARQLAGDKGVAELGQAARTTPPGTEALGKVFAAAQAPVLVLFDEVLNFLNRHRSMAEPFHAFLQNLTVAMTGTTHGAAVISLPRSQIEMTDWDLQWQELITKVVRRVAKDLIANDEAEISEVVRRRLFEDLGGEKLRKNVAREYADWCFERRAQLPPEWTAVDTATTEAKSREYLQTRFEACYPFHPATLSVFQRKWQALHQYQQTRGTLAMLAQWASIAFRESHIKRRAEPLVTLGTAPLDVPEFRAVVLGQLGESRLLSAIETDIAGNHSHATALDVDSAGPLRGIHHRVATAILFESSGGQADKSAHLPELRFALGEPGLDTTSIDNAAHALEAKAFFIRRVGTDGFQIHHKATLRKAVSDRRAGLDEEREIQPTTRTIVKKEFEKGATLPLSIFPVDGSEITDSPRLTLAILDPQHEWDGNGGLRKNLAHWVRKRGTSDRLYPGALIFCARKPGRDLRDKVELLLAWKRVAREVEEGTLGAEYDKADRMSIQAKITEAEQDARDEVWGGYRYVVLFDSREPDGLKVIDLGAGHASSSMTLAGRVIESLKASALLNDSPGAGYLDRRWPPALKESGAWPLAGLRQAFLNGSIDRVLDPDAYLRTRVPDFVARGEFGLASGPKPDGTYERVWFEQAVSPDEISFDPGVFLLRKDKAAELKTGGAATASQMPPTFVPGPSPLLTPVELSGGPIPEASKRTLRLSGSIPPELWNRLGSKIIPKLRAGDDLRVGIDLSVSLAASAASGVESDLHQILEELGLSGSVRLAWEQK